MNAIENARTRGRTKDRAFEAISAEVQAAHIGPNEWQERTDIAPVLERLRRYAMTNPAQANQIWDRFVPGDADKPDFLNSRDGPVRDPGERPQEAPELPRETTPASLLETQLRKRYLFDQGTYHYREAHRGIAFIDTGNALRTDSVDPAVLRSMVDLAQARGWTSLGVQGTTEFRRAVWLFAGVRGLQVKGHQPTSLDRAELAERISEFGTRSEASTRGGVQSESAAQPDEEIRLSARQSQYVDAFRAEMQEKGLSENAISKVLAASRQLLTEKRTSLGRVIEHGEAPYEFKDKESVSYYVRLDTEQGERTIWGKDIDRALRDASIERGDTIALQHLGATKVLVDEHLRDEQGQVIETRKKETVRNTWKAVSLAQLAEPDREHYVSQARSSSREPQVRVWDRMAPAAVARRTPAIRPQRAPERTHS